ncbi:MAG TPA: hypothetical protein H9903_21050 [Candidatus Aquabacterium excrementipullorum]|nr:hypothetical protein [Candidatus Aquabacterium excrementipullorum]
MNRMTRVWACGRRVALGVLGFISLHAQSALVAEYRFEETSYAGTAGEVIDSSGNGNHGTMVGGVTSVAGGKVCRGMYVPRNTDATIQAFNTGMDVNTIGNKGTISFWYKSVKTGSEHRMLFDASPSAAGRFYLYRDDANSGVDLNFHASDGGGSLRDVDKLNAVTDESWAHIAVTWSFAAGSSASRMRLYVDGVLDDTETYTVSSGALNSAIGNLFFGDQSSASYYAEVQNSAYGYIDQIRIYNHELTASEVSTDMSASPTCSNLHHLVITTAAASVAAGASTTFTVKACADAACSTLYTGGVSGTLSLSGTGLTVSYTSGPGFTIASGSSTATVVASASPTGTLNVSASAISPTPVTTPLVYCGLGVTATSSTSCALPVTSQLHHLELTSASASGLTCTPNTFTVKACQDAACSTTYTGGITGNLALTGTGVTVNYPSGAGFTIASGSSSATVSAQVTTAGSVTASLTSLSLTPSGSPQLYCGMGAAASSSGTCAYATASAALLLSAVNHAAEASSTLTVSAVRASDNATTCIPAFASVSKSVTLKCAYGNPTSGTLPVRVGGTALNSGANAAAACDAGGRSISLSFNASGTASATLQYADVGQMTVSGSYTGSSGSETGLSMAGSTTFIALPASLAISGVTAGPVKAGSSFGATVTARNSAGNAAPNFGKEATPATVTLGFTKAKPVGGFNGTFSGSLGTFSGGIASATNLSWSEVGHGDLSAALTGGTYLGVSNPLSTSTGSAGSVGAFIPHHYAVTTTDACGAFTFSGQPFGVKVTAYNAANGVTQNFDGTGSMTPIQAVALTLSAASNSAGIAGTLANGAVAASSFTKGVADITALSASPVPPNFTFTNKPAAPTTISLRATDGSGITSSGYSEGAVILRSGRLKLFNKFGSEKQDLKVDAHSQYWTGRAWVINALDNCTKVPTASMALSNYQDNRGVATATWTTAPAGQLSIAGGKGQISFSTPSSAKPGSVDLALNLGNTATDQSCLSAHPGTTAAKQDWLRGHNGSCSASADRDPSARLTFGIYSPETVKTIHARELF